MLVMVALLACKGDTFNPDTSPPTDNLEPVPIADAAVEATRRRFRPIIMTSFAFILGVVPLMKAGGAGAASQQAIGTVVFGGMLASTLIAIPFVPVFYVITQRFSERHTKR